MSHRGELTERMLHLPLLLAERRHSQQELAQIFKVKVRTIRRDIDALSRYYPIVDERDGRAVMYRFSDDYRYHPPPLTPIELATLLLAQESIAATGLTALGSPFARYGRSLLAKVRSSLHPLVRDKLDALAAVFGSASVAAKDFAPHAILIDRLTQAAVERRCVRLRYYTLATDSVTERTVEPYAVYFDPDGATLKLIGYDHHRKKVIPFAIDHIRVLRETEETFQLPADFDLQSYLSANCFNGIHGEPITVRLRASGVTARVFAERLFHQSQHLVERTPRTSRQAETTTIEMHVAGGRGLLRFILSWGPDVEVLAPSDLRLEVTALYQQALERYARDGKT
ncbi:MAG: putative transcriptional regulator [Acidobacteria bacterium]|nr:putative transcriptional regulator [Acidobacteriota bacterium]